MARATHEDMAHRYDIRVLQDLASDSGTPVLDLSTSSRLTAALEGATGQFEAAVRVGGIYSADDLDALTGSSQALMKDIVCELALLRLVGARIETLGKDSYEAVRRRAEDYLTALRNGERLFPLEAQEAAGRPSVNGPTSADYEKLNLLPDRVRRYYPRRSGRLPLGRG